MLKVLRATLLSMCTWAAVAVAADAGSPAAPPSPSATEAAVKKALDAEQDSIGQCVVRGVKPGRWILTVKAAVTVNGAGQVTALTLGFEPAATATDKVRECVDKLLRELSYPKAGAANVTVERSWAYSSTEFRLGFGSDAAAATGRKAALASADGLRRFS